MLHGYRAAHSILGFTCGKFVYVWKFYKMFNFFTAITSIIDIKPCNGVQRVQVHRHANFRQNPSICCRAIAIFQFFKMAAVCHVGFVWDILETHTKGTWWSLSLCKIRLRSMQYMEMLKFAALMAKCLMNNLWKVHQKYYIILKIMRFFFVFCCTL